MMKIDNDSKVFSNSKFNILIIIFLFFLAFLIRLNRLSDPELDFHPTRQFRSFIIARGLYIEDGHQIDGINSKSAIEAKKVMGELEPPIMETIAKFSYELFGGERLWIPRVYTIIFWLSGGLFLYFLSRRYLTISGSLFTLAFFLFLPFGVKASQSFQPDSLMIMAEIASFLLIVKNYENPSLKNRIFLFLVLSLGFLAKPVSIFMIFWFLLYYYIMEYRKEKKIDYYIPLIFILSIMPALLYYIYIIFIKVSFLKYQAGGSFIPKLWFTISYWKGWLSIINKVIGYPAFFASLIGTLYLVRNKKKYSILFLWIGYINFGLIFNYHIHTHDYYQLQLISLVALTSGAIFQIVVDSIKFQNIDKKIFYIILFFSIIIYSLTSVAKFVEDSTAEINLYKEMGKYVNHSSKVLFYVEGDLELFLYYGNISGEKLPSRRTIEIHRKLGLKTESSDYVKLTKKFIKDKKCDYLLIYSVQEFLNDKKYRDYVDKNFKLVKKSDKYIILKKNT